MALDLGTPFTPLEQPRAHEFVADQIRRHIVLGIFTKDDVLPPERELAKLLGVGRATIQAALDILENEDLVQRRVGRHGGTFVAAQPQSKTALRRTLERIKRDSSDIEMILRLRELIEPAAAADAAKKRTREDIVALREAYERGVSAADDEESLKYDAEFHLLIAGASRNRHFVETVQEVRLKLRDVFVALPESELWISRSDREHGDVLAAIDMQDAEQAEEAMRDHVQNTAQAAATLLHPF